MIDYTQIAKTIVEEIVNEDGLCFYPAGFKPPHKGHFKAAKALAARSYVTEVVVVISKKVEFGITPEDSLKIWRMFLEAEPNSKINVRLAEGESPINDIFAYLNKNKNVNVVYVAGGDDESDDQSYLKSIQEKFPNIVKTISIHEKDGVISSQYVRDRILDGDFEGFKKSLPEAAFNKGFAKPIFEMLAQTIKEPPPQDGSEETATA